jgi:superfamily I DNA/RNA helicase
MGTPYIKRGHKSLKGVEQEGMYTLASLEEHHGLLTNEPWYNVLTKIGEEKTSYIIALLRRGTKLQSTPMIKLSTIHGAKGGEADNVLLLTDLSTKFSQEYEHNPDAINRLLYVALTRARQSLHIVLPTNGEKGFRI